MYHFKKYEREEKVHFNVFIEFVFSFSIRVMNEEKGDMSSNEEIIEWTKMIRKTTKFFLQKATKNALF